MRAGRHESDFPPKSVEIEKHQGGNNSILSVASLGRAPPYPKLITILKRVFLQMGRGSEESILQDSLSDGLLKYPQYTRPRSFRGMDVPEVLLSGNHKIIEKWRKDKSVKKTNKKRPDLMIGNDV